MLALNPKPPRLAYAVCSATEMFMHFSLDDLMVFHRHTPAHPAALTHAAAVIDRSVAFAKGCSMRGREAACDVRCTAHSPAPSGAAAAAPGPGQSQRPCSASAAGQLSSSAPHAPSRGPQTVPAWPGQAPPHQKPAASYCLFLLHLNFHKKGCSRPSHLLEACSNRCCSVVHKAEGQEEAEQAPTHQRPATLWDLMLQAASMEEACWCKAPSPPEACDIVTFHLAASIAWQKAKKLLTRGLQQFRVATGILTRTLLQWPASNRQAYTRQPCMFPSDLAQLPPA